MMTRSGNVLAVFALVVLIGGSNFVGVRFSNRELPPFWGAGLRFAVASLLFFAIARAQHVSLPRGGALAAAAAFGFINFGLSYALAYWGLLEAPAALAATLFAIVPLLTLVVAVTLGMERFRWSSLVGAVIAIAGVGVVFADQLRAVPPASVVALLLSAISVTAAVVLAKRLPRAHPIATNAIATVPGAALLLVLSFVAGEARELPTQTTTWIALVYLILATIVLFAGFMYIVQRWTASATSYATMLFPIVAVALGAVLARELVSAQFVVGTALVMLGTYLGALSQTAPLRAVVAAAVPRMD